MKTNREKYEHYWSQINARDADEIAKLFPGGMPRQFFCVGHYSSITKDVKEIRRYRKGVYQKSPPEKIFKADVESAMQIATDWLPPTPDDIFVHYKESSKYGVVEGAEGLTKINAGKEMAWHVEQLEAEIQRRKELYEPREGHAPCAYCQKQNPPSNMIEGRVTYRMNGRLHEKRSMYCADKPCASYDQMGHEG